MTRNLSVRGGTRKTIPFSHLLRQAQCTKDLRYTKIIHVYTYTRTLYTRIHNRFAASLNSYKYCTRQVLSNVRFVLKEGPKLSVQMMCYSDNSFLYYLCVFKILPMNINQLLYLGCKTIFSLSDCTYGAYSSFVSVLHVLIKEVVQVPL